MTKDFAFSPFETWDKSANTVKRARTPKTKDTAQSKYQENYRAMLDKFSQSLKSKDD